MTIFFGYDNINLFKQLTKYGVKIYGKEKVCKRL